MCAFLVHFAFLARFIMISVSFCDAMLATDHIAGTCQVRAMLNYLQWNLLKTQGHEQTLCFAQKGLSKILQNSCMSQRTPSTSVFSEKKK